MLGRGSVEADLEEEREQEEDGLAEEEVDLGSFRGNVEDQDEEVSGEDEAPGRGDDGELQSGALECLGEPHGIHGGPGGLFAADEGDEGDEEDEHDIEDAEG